MAKTTMMHNSVSGVSVAPFADSSFSGIARRSLTGVMAWLVAAQDRAEQKYRLQELDARMLRDIGLAEGVSTEQR